MRKFLVCCWLGMVLLSLSVMPAFARTPHIRADARHVINRSAVVIVAAQQAAKFGHQYLGLGKAVAHQRFARMLFRNGYYFRALTHSLRARALATEVIRLNKTAMMEETTLDQVEQKYTSKLPPDQDLDQQVEKNTEKDNTAADIDIGVDLPE